MAGQFGIDNLIKVLDFAIELGNVTGKGLEDGKINLSDIPLIVTLFDDFGSLSSVNWTDLPKEIKELDAEERTMIEANLIEKFDIPQDELEAKIEQAMSLAFSAVTLALQIKDFIATLKKQEVVA
jgi:hypothetical protein